MIQCELWYWSFDLILGQEKLSELYVVFDKVYMHDAYCSL